MRAAQHLAQGATEVAHRTTRRVGSAGNALREAFRSVIQETSDRCFLGCSLYLLGLAALGLLDAALIIWLWAGREYTIQLSLAIAGFVDLGVLLVLLVALFIRQREADRVQQEQLQAAIQAPFQPGPGEPTGAGGPWELAVPLLQPLIPPLVEVLQTAAAKGTSAVKHGAHKVSRLAQGATGAGGPSPGPGPEEEEQEGPDIEAAQERSPSPGTGHWPERAAAPAGGQPGPSGREESPSPRPIPIPGPGQGQAPRPPGRERPAVVGSGSA